MPLSYSLRTRIFISTSTCECDRGVLPLGWMLSDDGSLELGIGETYVKSRVREEGELRAREVRGRA